MTYKHIENLNIFNLKNDTLESYEEIISDLNNINQKKINSKYFYDKKGSKLFEKISTLEEYYPTRIETQIMDDKKHFFKEELPSNASIIEFGSGSNKKIKKLLNSLENPTEYISIDISYDFLVINAKQIAEEFPEINVKAICADLSQLQGIKKILKKEKKKIGFFQDQQ